jgi:hypothetical protein
VKGHGERVALNIAQRETLPTPQNLKTWLTVIVVLAFVAMSPAQDFAGSLKFKNVPVSSVLQVYEKLIDKKLVIEPGATFLAKPINLQTAIVEKKEALKLIESALLKQANVVVAPSDEKSVSVKLAKSKP